MTMNRFRNIAVRMRPKPMDEDEVPPETPLVEDKATPPALPDVPTPRRVAITAPPPAAKRNIWDLEESSRDPVDASTAPPRSAPAVPPQPNATPAPSGDGNRAKTRILGFHAEAMVSVGDAAERAAATGPVYPAGFLVVIEGPGRGAYFAVTTQVASIGRGADQDIALDFGDESISRSGHASVMYDAEQNRFFIGHGNKANAIRRNGSPVLATEEMAHGDTIRIGKTSLRFHAFCGEEFTWDSAEREGAAHD